MNNEFPKVSAIVGIVVIIFLILTYFSETNALNDNQHRFDVCVKSGKSYRNGNCS